MATERLITRDEVALHGSLDDGWTVIHGVVYALPLRFLNSHPGGTGAVLPALGDDGTDIFTSHHHSGSSLQQLETFKIGRVIE